MKKLLIITLILSIVSVVFMVFNFAASTDIYRDYVGTAISYYRLPWFWQN